MNRALLLLFTALVACAPATVSTPNYTYEDLPASEARALVGTFRAALEELDLRLEPGSERGARYAGSDDRAFLAIVDRFYAQNPGFCPLERGGFRPDAQGKQFLTLAARGTAVRGFVYDLSTRPQVRFAFFAASSRVVLATQPCRTVGGPSGKRAVLVGSQ